MKKINLFLLGSIIFIAVHSTFGQNGLHFDRTNDYVQTTYGGLTGTTNRTFEAWIYVDSTAPAANLTIVDYGVNAVGSRNTFMVNGNRGLSFFSGGTNANISSTNTGIIIDNQWTHVAFALDNGTGFLYVNGVQVGTGNLSNVNTPTGGSDLRIGQRVSGGSILFGGKIDEVRIWNIARTQQEISTNMNSEICGSPSGLEAYYKLDEGIASGTNTGVTTTVDEIAGANGTLLNFALTGATSNWVTGTTLSPGAIVNNQTLNECSGFSITVGSNTYTTTGNYSDTLVAAAVGGCDSIINTDLTISSLGINSQTLNECPGFSITIGSNTYTTTGNYSDTLIAGAANGCDSIINTNLTIAAAIDVTVTNTSPTLMANQTGATYRWLDCDNNFDTIPGATSQTYTATASGNYAVEITVGNCVDTSACDTITIVGINELTKKSIAVYPNPAINNIQVNLGTQVAILNYSLISITGKVIQENTVVNTNAISIDISNEAKGVYFLKLNDIIYRVIKK